DEFVALVPDIDAAGVVELSKRIHSAVSDFGIDVSPGEVARVGVSIGSSEYPASGEAFDQLIISADKAMYTQKAERKQRPTKSGKKVDVATLLAPPPTAEEYISPGSGEEIDPVGFTSGEMLVVELDESHVISTASVN
ncbi:MAG TPA: diguanylate cyclase, partial [Pyrinomonadaceae bacterium]